MNSIYGREREILLFKFDNATSQALKKPCNTNHTQTFDKVLNQTLQQCILSSMLKRFTYSRKKCFVFVEMQVFLYTKKIMMKIKTSRQKEKGSVILVVIPPQHTPIST
jgi:hypothetical protein